MARKPDTPCAGCGRLLWTGTNSRPAASRRCRPCRAEIARRARIRVLPPNPFGTFDD